MIFLLTSAPETHTVGPRVLCELRQGWSFSICVHRDGDDTDEYLTQSGVVLTKKKNLCLKHALKAKKAARNFNLI